MARPVSSQSHASAVLPEVLAEDRFLWQFWVNKGMKAAPLAATRAALTGPAASTNWDYIAGNALYGAFEQEVLRALPEAGSGVPQDFLERFARDVAGSWHRVTPTTPEGRLLVLCASPRMLAAEDDEAAMLASGRIEWEALVAAAARGNITAAVQHNFSRLQLDLKIPRPLGEVMAARARGIAARNGRVLGLLDEIISLLKTQQIRVLLLKESGLALSHFGNGRLRMMGDVDLLMGEREIDRVVALLESSGYQSAEVLWTKEHYRTAHHHAAPLVQPDLAMKIEPHHAISLPDLPEDRRLTTPGLISLMASRAVRLDAKAWCFTPADTLIHLCLDLFGGAFLGKMGQACDAREVVRQGGVDWPLLEETAAALGAEAHLAFSLKLISDLDAPVPAEVLARLRAARKPSFAAARLRGMADRNLFGYVRASARHSRPAEKLIFKSLLLPASWAGRATFLLRQYLYVGWSNEGVGELGRRAHPTTRQALGRVFTLPLRALRRWTSSRH